MNIQRLLAEYDKSRREQRFQDCLYDLRIMLGAFSKAHHISKYDYADVLEKLEDFRSVIHRLFQKEQHKYNEAIDAYERRAFEESWEILTRIGNDTKAQTTKEHHDEQELIQDEFETLQELEKDERSLEKLLHDIEQILDDADQKNKTITPETRDKLVRALSILNRRIRDDDRELRTVLTRLARRIKAA